MKKSVLKAAEKHFLREYPGGFNHPEMLEIGKKHRIDLLQEFAQESFAKAQFEQPKEVVAALAKLVSRSSMISMFEKPKFRDFAKSLKGSDKERLADAVFELLHGSEKTGFESLVGELKKGKLAKWPLATVVQSSYQPKKGVFVKPTTAKMICEKLDLGLEYKSTPTWDFYRKFRKAIEEMKAQTSKDLAHNNPAYCGFLMMALPKVS